MFGKYAASASRALFGSVAAVRAPVLMLCLRRTGTAAASASTASASPALLKVPPSLPFLEFAKQGEHKFGDVLASLLGSWLICMAFIKLFNAVTARDSWLRCYCRVLLNCARASENVYRSYFEDCQSRSCSLDTEVRRCDGPDGSGHSAAGEGHVRHAGRAEN